MVNSMTGFAARDGAEGGPGRAWEIRSVNARGLDVRMRLPEGLGGLEKPLRERVGGVALRGSVTVSLRLTREAGAGGAALNEVALAQGVAAMAHAANAAMASGLETRAPSAAEILGLPGVYEAGRSELGLPPVELLLAEFDGLLEEFAAMRAGEGAQLGAILRTQLDQVAALVERAGERAGTRAEEAAARLTAQVDRILGATESVDEARLAQELALLAVKGDVTEEIDRLRAHVEAARGLLESSGPVGRKLDFLMQEFNREANTLCAKSADSALTQAGLDLKVLIDQMREQVQNVE